LENALHIHNPDAQTPKIKPIPMSTNFAVADSNENIAEWHVIVND
jgi:hypothetical protein